MLERELEPKPAHRRDIDINLPLIPRLRDATWSFQTATLFSMNGMTDCTTSSRMNALIAVASEPKRYGVPSVPRSTKASGEKLAYVCLCGDEQTCLLRLPPTNALTARAIRTGGPACYHRLSPHTGCSEVSKDDSVAQSAASSDHIV